MIITTHLGVGCFHAGSLVTFSYNFRKNGIYYCSKPDNLLGTALNRFKRPTLSRIQAPYNATSKPPRTYKYTVVPSHLP